MSQLLPEPHGVSLQVLVEAGEAGRPGRQGRLRPGPEEQCSPSRGCRKKVEFEDQKVLLDPKVKLEELWVLYLGM